MIPENRSGGGLHASIVPRADDSFPTPVHARECGGELDGRVALLEATFRKIQHERMAGVPILHPELQVEAVGFRPWQDGFLGVLVTPWFMNLVLLPAAVQHVSDRPVGTTAPLAFPSGEFDFLLAHEEALGYYRTCSLFSPMGDFADQAGAAATAQAVMEELFREPVAETACNADSRVGEGNRDTPLRIDVKSPISRRDLLRGAFVRSA